MGWNDIVCIVFTCVTANHLGLIDAIENIAERKIPILNCVKCSVFWCVLIYTLVTSGDVIVSLAVSFLCSYCALWLELIEVYIDKLFMMLYGKVTKADDNSPVTADATSGDAEDPMPDMWEERRQKSK